MRINQAKTMIPIRFAANRTAFVQAIQLSLRASIAAALSYLVALSLGLAFPIYALIAAVIVCDLSPAQTRNLAIRRVVATVIGTLCGIAAVWLLPGNPLSVGVAIMVTMLICNLLRAPESAKIAGYVCAIIVIAYADDPVWYAIYRFIETVIGIAAAALVSVVPKLFVPENDPPATPG